MLRESKIILAGVYVIAFLFIRGLISHYDFMIPEM